MNMRITELNGANSVGYYDRLPEKLVLEGYRRWTAGFETGSIIPWEMTWGLYSELLGPSEAKRAVGSSRSSSACCVIVQAASYAPFHSIHSMSAEKSA